MPGMDFTIEKGLVVNVLPPGEECFKNPANFDPGNFDAENNPNKFGFTGFGQGPRAPHLFVELPPNDPQTLPKIFSNYSQSLPKRSQKDPDTIPK